MIRLKLIPNAQTFAKTARKEYKMKSQMELSILEKLRVWPYGANLKQIESLATASETETRETVTRLWQSRELSFHNDLYCLPQFAINFVRQAGKEKVKC